jgi:hypothetical protein
VVLAMMMLFQILCVFSAIASAVDPMTEAQRTSAQMDDIRDEMSNLVESYNQPAESDSVTSFTETVVPVPTPRQATPLTVCRSRSSPACYRKLLEMGTSVSHLRHKMAFDGWTKRNIDDFFANNPAL